MWRIVRAQGGLAGGAPRKLAVSPARLLDSFVVDSDAGEPSTPPSSASCSRQPTRNFEYPGFAFTRITERDVEEAIKRCTSKSPGPDGISPQALLLFLPALKRPLTAIYNASLSRGVYPQEWKEAAIVPVPKVPTPTSCKDYRPIAVGNCVGKVLDKIVLGQVSSFLESSKALSPAQFGFRKHHSAELALVGVLDPIREAMDRRRLSLVVGLDLSRVYDTIRHELLTDAMRDLNFTQEALAFFASFLRDRRATLRTDEGPHPGWRRFQVGVPQGSSLSPTLFNIYVEGVTRLGVGCRLHLYADDLLLVAETTGPQLREAIDGFNVDVNKVCGWLGGMGLKVNPGKCVAAIVGNRRLRQRYVTGDTPAVRIGGTPLAYRDSFRYLGITISEDLSWRRQVYKEIINKHYLQFYKDT
ncbi:hypothetical protein J437_LFUL009889 [Ladona fulva]|uniref:Reverse transcriptase domain-containing protein n=1 Tax=Ladona fulva TaxID=123851 RepID=A0A8K0K6B6_LADFU|nr:hypothetical protein J437_LFUL009889 [Ladona fulva]